MMRAWLDETFASSAVSRLRVLFFSVVAVDAWLQIAHAPRYGAGGFDLPHFETLALFWPTPGRTTMVAVYVLQSLLALRIVFGASIVPCLRVLTVLYGWGYFASQLDSYQHHALVFLFLATAWTIPWDEARSGADRVPGWGVRLIVVELAVVYAWAAIAKLDPLWLDGTALRAQVGAPWARHLAAAIGWATAARTVVALELALAISLVVPRLRAVALVLGLVLHVVLDRLGLEIGRFSWILVAVYLGAVVPESIERRLPKIPVSLPRLPGATIPVALALGAAALWLLPLPTATAAVAATLFAAWRALRGGPSDAAKHLAACALVLVLHASTDQALLHWRTLGGDSLRRGELDVAVAAYERAADLDDSPRTQGALCRAYEAAGVDRPARCP